MSLEIQYRALPTIEEALQWRGLGQVDRSPEHPFGGFMHSQDVNMVGDMRQFWESFSEGLAHNPPISRVVSLGRKEVYEFFLYENLLGEQVVIYYEDPLPRRKI
jgi:hypothetical protein